jgi:hypothetical protein
VSKYILATEESLTAAVHEVLCGGRHLYDVPESRRDAAMARDLLAAHPRETTDTLMAVVEAARTYSPRADHDWRCEYRTAEKGWKAGDPPVIDCECGYDRLQEALDALRERMEAGS